MSGRPSGTNAPTHAEPAARRGLLVHAAQATVIEFESYDDADAFTREFVGKMRPKRLRNDGNLTFAMNVFRGT